MNGLAWLDALGPQRMRPGLRRTRALLDALGSPDSCLRSVLVAGTNGKGSAAAALSALLHAAGVRTGLFTSPHLVRVTERIRIGEADVPESLLADALSLVAALSGPGERGPTYFEALTVAALELFRRARLEVAVLEVGIGGRLDATNVVMPELSVVTNVGADHLELLGPTLADVAREKAGIFRQGRPALVGSAGSAPEAMAVLRAEAARTGALLREVPPSGRWDGVFPLAGVHQRGNVALAVAAARALAPLDEKKVAEGLARTRWPGRLQRIERPGRRPLILDGAHNPDGAEALARWLDAEGLSGRVDLLFGVMRDKDLTGIFAPLGARARLVVFAAPPSPRAAAPETLRAHLGREDAQVATSVAEALLLLGGAAPGAPPVLVAGSLYLVGEVLRILETESG
ncbi:MAG: bifunctional folylpolyglutamate synthase/dihydrofolate synthase [Acidithiobacillales bacterium]